MPCKPEKVCVRHQSMLLNSIENGFPARSNQKDFVRWDERNHPNAHPLASHWRNQPNDLSPYSGARMS